MAAGWVLVPPLLIPTTFYGRADARRRLAGVAAVALIVLAWSGPRDLDAQSGANPRVDALAALAEAKMREHGVPGVALGVVADGVVSIRGLGVTSVDDPLPITAHTVFPIASISKTFAATAMMRLVEQGKVELRAPVRTYLPEFRVRDEAASRVATIWHLLTHLGGWEGQVSGPDRGTETLENFVGSITDLMQVAPPDQAWSYNNAGFSIAGRVIEQVVGTPINRAVRDLVFQPLGLEHAGTTAGDFIVQRFAAGHTTREGRTTLQRPFTASTSVTAGGVGVCMTDLLAYARFHMGEGMGANGERVLKRESLEQMRTAQMRKQGTDDQIGLAWHMRQVGPIRTFSHGGTLGGHILLLEIVPGQNFAIAILTNASTGWRLIQDVERAALKSYLGVTYAPQQAIAHRGLVETLPWAEPAAQQPDPAPYLGTYRRPNNSYVVHAEGGKLFVHDRPHAGGTPREFPVAFYGPDRLIVTDGPDRGQSMEFVRDGGGRVNWIRVVGRVAVRAPQVAPSLVTIRQRQVGPVSLGASAQSIYEAFRGKSRLIDLALEGHLSPALELSFPETQVNGGVVAELVPRGNDLVVWRIAVTNPNLRTEKGIGVGSSVAQLRSAYPITSVGTGEGRVYVVVDELGASFQLDTSGPAGDTLWKLRDPQRVPGEVKITRVLLVR